MVNLITAIAYDPEKNLGRAYNEVMKRMYPDDWVCFIDHDAMFTTWDWYTQLQWAINQEPNAGMFTAITNRIGNREQKIEVATHDMLVHRAYGSEYAKQAVQLKEAERPISGVLMCLSKQTWEDMGGFKPGFLGVDNRAHTDIVTLGKKVYIISSLYLYHWYRGDGDHSHLQGAKTCR